MHKNLKILGWVEQKENLDLSNLSFVPVHWLASQMQVPPSKQVL